MSEEKKEEKKSDDPYQKYKDFKWENEDAFKNGPISDESRKCRDIFCCIIWVIFVVGCVVVAVLGFANGDPSIIIYPYDEDGNACGKDGEYKDYPYIYFYNAVEDAKNLIDLGKEDQKLHSFCVKECPQDKLEESSTTLQCVKVGRNQDCKIDKTNYYRSKGIINRLCIPYTEDDDDSVDYDAIFLADDNNKYEHDGKTYIEYEFLKDYLKYGRNSTEGANELFNWSYFDTDKLISWMVDLYECWIAIALSFVWSLILCMVFLLFVRCCAGVIIYIIIFLILVCLTGLGAFFFVKREEYDEVNDSEYYNAMIVLAWIFWGFAFIWLIFIICMCNRIRLAVALLEATARYIHENCYITLVPFLFFLISIAWYAYWIVLSIFLYSTGEFDKENSSVIAQINWDQKIRYSWWFHLFSLFYWNELINAYSQFVYASTACIWYFTHEKGTDDHPIKKSFWRGCRYHCGSLAFGALILAIIKFIMAVLEYLKKKVDQTFGKKAEQSKIYKCIICCCQCCMACIARTIEFINKHAYIQIALKGDNFCTAAWEGFGLLVRNLGRFSTLILLGSFFTFFGTLFIAGASGFIGYLVITKVSYFSDNLNSPVLPTFVMGMVGLIIGLVSMNVYGMSSDALMHSFLLDEELNKGQAKAYPELAKFMASER